ncbi:RNA-dependent RNA polymerase [viral metagenome]|uniref:RNA-dependent RNA polymerase n=1 Tax=viral metagenome TaxID=1070528 RepID=A0A6L2ZK48_9ZZZZ
MENITHQLKRLTVSHPDTTNFTYVGQSPFRPTPPRPNPVAIENHKKTCLKAFIKYLYTSDVEFILTQRTRSSITEESVLADFFHGDLPYHHVSKDHFYQEALDYTRRKFAPPLPCRPVHILDVEHHYPHRNSSNAEAPFSTEPFFTKQLDDPIYRERHHLPENPRRSFGNMKNIIFDWTRRFLHEIKDAAAPYEKYLYYILLHSKTALIDVKDPNKMRTISGFPRPQNIAYIMLLWAYFAHCKRNVGSTPLLWGYETITGGWLRLNFELFRNHARSSIVTLDKSRFDKYYSFQIQDDIDDMVRSFLDFHNGYMPTREYAHTRETWNPQQAQRLDRLWQYLCYSFRQAPIVLFDGSMYRRKWLGMPSGVYTTQLYDTMHFCITNATVLFSMGIHEHQILLYKGEGDDILFQIAMLIQPNEHHNFLSSYANVDNTYFGSLTRPEKCEVTNSPKGTHVLGYRNNNGFPHRDHRELLAQMYHTKMADPSPSKTMATAIGIAYALCGYHKPSYNVCKDIFSFYARQGFTPDEKTFRETFYQDVISELPIDIQEFPTIAKIQANLMNFSYSPPPTMKTFWPNWFLAEY